MVVHHVLEGIGHRPDVLLVDAQAPIVDIQAVNGQQEQQQIQNGRKHQHKD